MKFSWDWVNWGFMVNSHTSILISCSSFLFLGYIFSMLLNRSASVVKYKTPDISIYQTSHYLKKQNPDILQS